jgi:hypothetical protein
MNFAIIAPGFASRAGAAVLELGSVPLPWSPRIDRFIAESRKGPYRDME